MSHVAIRPVRAVALATLLGVLSAGIALAEPQPAQCTYQLTPPQVVAVSGVNMVSVSVNPVGCKEIGSIYRTTACASSALDTTGGRCAEISGFRTAQVYYPYIPGTTYTATGTGCGGVYHPYRVTCEPLGPISAAL